MISLPFPAKSLLYIDLQKTNSWPNFLNVFTLLSFPRFTSRIMESLRNHRISAAAGQNCSHLQNRNCTTPCRGVVFASRSLWLKFEQNLILVTKIRSWAFVTTPSTVNFSLRSHSSSALHFLLFSCHRSPMECRTGQRKSTVDSHPLLITSDFTLKWPPSFLSKELRWSVTKFNPHLL